VKTETGMLQWLASALGIEGVQPPAGRRTLRVLEAEDGSSLPPISGGSDADSVGSNVRATDMAPQAPQRSDRPGKAVALLVSLAGQLSGSSRSKTLNGERRAASSAFLICGSPRPAPCRSRVSKNPT